MGCGASTRQRRNDSSAGTAADVDEGAQGAKWPRSHSATPPGVESATLSELATGSYSITLSREVCGSRPVGWAHSDAESCCRKFSIRSSHSSRHALKILETKDSHTAILQHPTRASLPDGSLLLGQFKRIFCDLQGNDEAGVTPCKLEAALHSFARALPNAVAVRLAFVVGEVFEEIDTSKTGVITWPDFVNWLQRRDVENVDHDEALSELFELCDTDGTGRVSAQDLMDVLVLMSELGVHRGRGNSLTVDVAEAIVRDLDSSGEGGFGFLEFMEVIHAARARHKLPKQRSLQRSAGHCRNEQPHLVLNFDVNNTIMMLDTATGADCTKLLGAVLANTAWGTIQEDETGKKHWVLQHPEISVLAPAPSLITYKAFVDSLNPVNASASKEQNATAKGRRRAAVWSFTDPGQPGECFRPELEKMHTALLLPPEVRGTEKAIAAGLTGDTVQLLPSFLRLLRELKRERRSFMLMFRTFGHDLALVQKELNALCEGRHPLFPEEDPIVLDGSDGLPDYRMRLDTPQGCGAFFRNPSEDVMALAMGTTCQPRTMEEFPSFYDGLDHVVLLQGHRAIVSHLVDLRGQQCTVALRDFYLGWAATGLKSHGGKPFFLSWHDDGVHSIFFDDNITAADPQIVDPINAHHWPHRFCSPQLFGVHLVQAQPLHSILKQDYFLECVRECEAARQAKLSRWELAQSILGDLAGVQQVLTALVSETARVSEVSKSFQPWCMTGQVSCASKVGTFEEDMPADM